MSKQFLWTVIALLSCALAFFVWLHGKEIQLIDKEVAKCTAQA
jgi:regulatory protein YycH of two-component signal transduction system YycFG